MRFSWRTAIATAVLVGSVLGSGVAANAVTRAPQSSSSATVTLAAPSQLQLAKSKKGRDLGPCWAQTGRVVGGFYGAIGTTIVSPWAGAAAWATYLGTVAQEKKDKYGNFVC